MVRVPVGGSRAFIILVHRADPDRGETCVLDVVEVLPDGIPGSTTPSRMRNSSTQIEKDTVPGLVLRFASGWVCTSRECVTVGNNSGKCSLG